MALIDRVFRDNADSDFKDYIDIHEFSAALWFFAKGDFTRADVIVDLSLATVDEVQLDQLIAHYQGMSNQDKKTFHSDIESAGILAAKLKITRTKYKSLLGLI